MDKLNNTGLISGLEDKFNQFLAQIVEVDSTIPIAARQASFHSFKALGGFPTTKNEEWRYTSLKDANAAIDIAGSFVNNLNSLSVALEDIKPLTFSGLEATHLVFINGQYCNQLSSEKILADNITVCNFADAKLSKIAGNHETFGKLAKAENDSLVALNGALFQDGAYITINAQQRADLPIICHYIDVPTDSLGMAVNVRSLIHIAEGASANITEIYYSHGESLPCFTNVVSEIVIEKNASLQLTKIQRQHQNATLVDTTEVLHHDNAHSNITTLTFSGATVRNNLHLRLEGSLVDANMNGLYAITGKTLVDNHTVADHLAPNSISSELYKGMIGGKATGVFNGKIFVRQIAQKTNAFQSNRNILLSDNSKAYTKPQLEIFADDVKCSHGCTVGALDEDPIFYLRARGLDEDSARSLLLYAYAAEVFDKIEIAEIASYASELGESIVYN